MAHGVQRPDATSNKVPGIQTAVGTDVGVCVGAVGRSVGFTVGCGIGWRVGSGHRESWNVLHEVNDEHCNEPQQA
jgi:hypothetical protein